MLAMLTNKRIIGTILLALIAFAIGMGFGTWKIQNDLEQLNSTMLTEPRTLVPFKLLDEKGQVFSNKSLQGRWTFMFFGFTHCAGICPTTMSVLNKAYEKIQANKQILPQVILVTIDPSRDNVKSMQQYVSLFNPEFRGITGSEDQIDKLTNQLEIVYEQVKQGSVDKQHVSDYQISHGGTLFLINPEGKLYAVFSAPLDESNVVKDYSVITKFYRKSLQV